MLYSNIQNSIQQYTNKKRQKRTVCCTAASCQQITNVEYFGVVILCVKSNSVVRQAIVTSGIEHQCSDSICAFKNIEIQSTILSRELLLYDRENLVKLILFLLLALQIKYRSNLPNY